MIKAKFQNLQDLNLRIFKYFQAPYLFSSTFKGLEVFIPNSIQAFSRISQAHYEPFNV